MAETKKTITQRKTEAKAEAVPQNEMVAYRKHFAGMEDQYSYAEFLEDCQSPDAPSRKWSDVPVQAVVIEPTPKPEVPVVDVE
jgi:hypothetical protein